MHRFYGDGKRFERKKILQSLTVFTFSRWIRCLNVEIPIFCRILFDDIVLLLITRAHWISRALPVIIITFFFQTEFWWKQCVEVQHEFAYINNKQISWRIFYFFNHFCKSTIQWFVILNAIQTILLNAAFSCFDFDFWDTFSQMILLEWAIKKTLFARTLLMKTSFMKILENLW